MIFNKNFSYNGYTFNSKEDFLIKVENLISEFKEKYNKDNLNFLKDFLSEKKNIIIKTSGSTGEKKDIFIKKEYMVNSSLKTGKYFSLKEKSKVLLCLPSEYISGKMMLVRSIVLGLDLIALEPKLNPLKELKENIYFVAMTPLQLFSSIEYSNKVKNILLGGDKISKYLENKIKNIGDTNFYHSYGMTETVSHIAIRNIKKEIFFTVLENIKISINNNNCLVIESKDICSHIIETKDIVKIIDIDKFIYIGRYDNMINSGGIKLFSEEVELKLEKILDNKNYFLIGKEDFILGQKIILFIEGEEFDLKELKLFFKNNIERYKIFKDIIFMKKFIYTDTGKINRNKTLEYYEKFS